MKGAIATVDVFVHAVAGGEVGDEGGAGTSKTPGPGRARRLSLTITAPERAPGGWSCRVALADRNRPETFVAEDSLSALVAAVEQGRSWLAELEARGHRLTRDRAGSEPFTFG